MPYYTKAVGITAKDSEHPGLGQDVVFFVEDTVGETQEVPRNPQTRDTPAMKWLALRLTLYLVSMRGLIFRRVPGSRAL